MNDKSDDEIDIASVVTPALFVAKFAEIGIVISERTLRQHARRIGACRIIGKAMFFLQEDIDALFEAAKPEPKVRRTFVPLAIAADPTEEMLKRLQLSRKIKNRGTKTKPCDP